MAVKEQNINYLNKSFSDFKISLKEFAKSYFPNTYADFSDVDPGTMFLEMAAYIGDINSFYIDSQIQENFFLRTQEKDNAIESAYVLGYTPKMSYSSVAEVDVYQVVASVVSASVTVPSWSYATKVSEYTTLTAVNGTKFLTIEEANFTQAANPEIIFRDSNSYFLKQTIKAISAEIEEIDFTFGSPEKFAKVSIEDDNILGIIKVISNTGDIWYEVPYLAENKIATRTTNGSFSSDGVPYILSYIEVDTRFVSRFINETTLELQFGAGVSNLSDKTFIPNMNELSLGNSLVPVTYFQGDYNKIKNLYTKEYGVAPANITLTVSYLKGGGLESNVGANTITQIDTSNVSFSGGDVYQSIIVTNPDPSTGGRSGDTLDEIKLNSTNAFQAQNRTVTTQDYALRALSLPSDFGSISKAICFQDNLASDKVNNPLALSLYVLAYDSNNYLTTPSTTLKNNLKIFLQEYKMATDAINIKNAFIVNIGINFDITVNPGFSNNEVLSSCISILKEYFTTDRWQINQPIILSEIYSQLLQTKGVQSVLKVEIINKQGGTYSQYGYDIQGATRRNIIYPSIDPCIFELKYKNEDIFGRVIVP
jgi:hypothetical protein